MNKINCFISYCYDKLDRASLEYFIGKLKNKRIFPNLTIKYDHIDDKIKNWNDFIAQIKSSDVVIVICTPSYKKKTIDHIDGVHKEFNEICEIYFNKKIEAEAKARTKENVDLLSSNEITNFDLIPILMQGTEQSSIPDLIIDEGIRYLDFSDYRVISEKKSGKTSLKISNNQKIAYDHALKKIKARVLSVNRYINGGYVDNLRKQWDKLRIDELFKQTKANFGLEEHIKRNYHSKLFVNTYAYKQVATQAKYIFIGRKGSGKSALLQVASFKLSSKYSYIIPIERSSMDIFVAYNIFTEELNSDTTFLSKRIVCFSYAWRLFIRLQIMENIVDQYFQEIKPSKKYHHYSSEIEKKIMPMLEKIHGSKWEDYIITNPDKSKRNHLFIYSLSVVFEFLRHCISKARPDQKYLFSDIERRFNYTELTNYVFIDNINEIVDSILKYNKKNILITFDDADSYYQDIYSEKGDQIKRHQYELDLLYALLSFVLDVKQMKRSETLILSTHLDFIITISSEHFFEILNLERDSYRLDEYYSVIFWTGIELALMLRKRLEVAYDYRVNKNTKTDVKNTLFEVMRIKLKAMPQMIKFTMENGTRHEMHIFLYILRFTFWRPRDILRYFAKIFSQIQDSYSTIDSETIRLIVRRATHDIIEHEFINEYKGFILNILEIVHCFDESDQILSYAEVKEKIDSCNFLLALKKEDNLTPICKIKHLYQIGFLGIFASTEMQLDYNLKLNTAFIFNEGAELINALTQANKEKYSFTIHPIFQSYLHLKMDPDKLLCNYTWEYLEELEDLMSAANHSYFVKLC